MTEPEICDGLPIPPDHPRFFLVHGSWYFDSYVQAILRAEEWSLRDHIEDCRNCARCYWLDEAEKALNATYAATHCQCLKYADMARVWRLNDAAPR